MKVDKMTMAHGLEARCPFLDHELVDFIARLPLRWKIRGSQTKVLLKQVAARYLPSSIVHRGKHGFETPILSWLRGPLRELGDELFSPRTLSRHSMLSVQASQDLWKRVQSQPEEVHPRHAWTLFSLLAWSHAFDLPLAVADP
jgi:asparagine synthase (glutamine-hydrolysing)